MSISILRTAFALACVAFASGCISHQSTVIRDTERTRVEFENDGAARLFYEALSQSPVKNEKSESTTEYGIPIIFEHKRHVITGSNAGFNRAVEICDSNKDGKITELEAKIFREQSSKQP
jgi:hypothetical protein